MAKKKNPFDGWPTVPGSLAAVHVALDVAKVKVTPASVVELDVCLDLFIEKVVFPSAHRDDAPTILERILFLRHRSPSLPPIRRDVRDQSLVEGDLLNFPRSMANIHHEPVDLKH